MKFFARNEQNIKIFYLFFLLNLKLDKNSDKECDNVTKSKLLHVAYKTLMAEIWPESSDTIIGEIAESSLKIDPHNANPFIVLTHRLCGESENPYGVTMAARISEIDPTSPYAQYLLFIVIIDQILKILSKR